MHMFSHLVQNATLSRTARLLVDLTEVQLATILVPANTATGHLVWTHPEIRAAPSQCRKRTVQYCFLQ